MAAAAEQLSSHVLAQSVIRAATERGLAIPEVTEGREWATHGVRASVGGHWVRVGKPAFVAEAGVAIPDRHIVGGEVAVYVAVDDRYAGILRLADRPRSEARDTVRRLRDMGIRHTLMVTGDAEPTAQAIAREVGVVDVRAECLPADKVAIVRNEPLRPIMMVGDGVNDAPVLAAADVGVAMGARGATAAAQSADVVILRDTLELVADTVSIGQRTVSVALQSIWLGIGLSVGLMIVAAFGVLPPVFGAVSQEVVDLAAIGNALRAVSSGRRE
jgi:P-type E1-E2 ATPase